jgi:hypothetical protein
MPFVETSYWNIYWMYSVFILSLLIMWNRRDACRVLIGKPEGKRPVGRPRCRWENNVKMVL